MAISSRRTWTLALFADLRLNARKSFEKNVTSKKQPSPTPRRAKCPTRNADTQGAQSWAAAVFRVLNTIGWTTFYWHWKHISPRPPIALHARIFTGLLVWNEAPVALSIVRQISARKGL